MNKNIDIEMVNLQIDENRKYDINHKETKNRELGVTIVEAISKVTGKSISEINLDKYFNMDGLNQIFQNFDEDSPITSKITFHIENHKIEIYNNKDITITKK